MWEREVNSVEEATGIPAIIKDDDGNVHIIDGETNDTLYNKNGEVEYRSPTHD